MNSPVKKIAQLNLKYDNTSLIPNNPNQKPHYEHIMTEKIPHMLSKLQKVAKFSNDIIHTMYQVKLLSDKIEYRKGLIYVPGFIDTMCNLLTREEDLRTPKWFNSSTTSNQIANSTLTSTVSNTSSNLTTVDALLRCKQHALGILINLIALDPSIDAFLVGDESCLAGLAKLCVAQDSVSQELAATALYYLTLNRENQSIICFSDKMLYGIVRLLHNTKSIVARVNTLKAIQNMICFSEAQLAIPREPGLIDELNDSLFYVDDDRQIAHLVVFIVTYICQVRENVPLIARNNELKRRIETILSSVETASSGKGVEQDQYDDKSKSAAELSDDQMMEQGSFLTDLWQQFEKRLNSKMILQNDGYYSPIISTGKYECKSVIIPVPVSVDNSQT